MTAQTITARVAAHQRARILRGAAQRMRPLVKATKRAGLSAAYVSTLYASLDAEIAAEQQERIGNGQRP